MGLRGTRLRPTDAHSVNHWSSSVPALIKIINVMGNHNKLSTTKGLQLTKYFLCYVLAGNCLSMYILFYLNWLVKH